MRRIQLAALAAVFLLGTLGSAAAQPAKPPKGPPPPTKEQLDKARDAFLEGKRLIEEEKKYVPGVEKFKEAYRLSRNPVLLYNIGFTYDDLIKDKNLAVFYYEKFLKDAPASAPNRDLAAERIKTLKRELEADGVFGGGGEVKPGGGEVKPGGGEVKPGGEVTPGGEVKPGGGEVKPGGGEVKPGGEVTPGGEVKPGGEEPPARRPVTTLEHIAVEEAPPGRPLDITAYIPEKARWQVTLFYRAQNESKFNSTPMKPRYNELVGRIPPDKMAGTSMQYYIEARDAAGKVVASSGRSISPNLVFIDAAAKPRFYPDMGGGGAETLGGGEGGGGGGGSGGASFGGGGGGGGRGQVDTGRQNKLKWGATGAAGGLLALSITFYLMASGAASDLEAEAYLSGMDNCLQGPPCRSFSDRQKELQDKGRRYETWSQVTFFVGAAAAGVAGWYWYKEYRDRKRAGTAAQRTVVIPNVGDGFAGATAVLEF